MGLVPSSSPWTTLLCCDAHSLSGMEMATIGPGLFGKLLRFTVVPLCVCISDGAGEHQTTSKQISGEFLVRLRVRT